jgi:hypothetical protein
MSDEVQRALKIAHDKKLTRFGFIMNTDTASGKGLHWTAFYIDTIEDKVIEFYDSFADPIPVRVLKQLKWYVCKLPYMLKLKENLITHQDVRSFLCGYHAARFLKKRFEGQPFKIASRFSKVLKNEPVVEKMAMKYKRFGYI